MFQNQHQFHIPVMGLGHSADSPIRVAHLGINSVISIVDDQLLESIRKYYSNQFELPYKNIPQSEEDSRAKRITAYLETVQEIVQQKFEELRAMPLFNGTEKDRYFSMLPDSNPLKKTYNLIASLGDEDARNEYIRNLTEAMRPGSIDVNIMAKVDALRTDKNDELLSAEQSDGSAALRGFARSSLSSGLVLSAGFNPRLYSYLSEFRDFYRDSTGNLKKKIILKVSDFRSALIQGKFLAKKGLEVSEFRIESGLNCGGHAFPSDGQLLPVLLQEFREKRDQLADTFRPMIQQFYESQGWDYPEVSAEESSPAVTVQGGIGTNGEMKRLFNDFGVDGTGWGTPFLLVPEATCVDDETTKLLEKAGEEDLYLSNVSPFGIPFNNVRGSGSQNYTRKKVEEGKPGSKCPKGFLVSNTEFTENPICTASSQYQLLKVNQIEETDLDTNEKEKQKSEVLEKTCLCTNLGAGALIRLGIRKPDYGRQSVCPGSNLAWFDRTYSLEEMIDHIYGRGPSLVPETRPHMFARELVMYVDYLETLLEQAESDSSQLKKLNKISKNLLNGMDKCLEIAELEPFENENLESLQTAVNEQKERLAKLFSEMEAV
jgi:hypothetical protein